MKKMFFQVQERPTATFCNEQEAETGYEPSSTGSLNTGQLENTEPQERKREQEREREQPKDMENVSQSHRHTLAKSLR